jgi:hypothetical protein
MDADRRIIVSPMADGAVPTEGQVLTGPLFNEPMRVETVCPQGPGTCVVGVVGVGNLSLSGWTQ